MADIRYFEVGDLELLAEELRNPENGLAELLPPIGRDWVTAMMGIVERARIHPHADIHGQAARIFANVIKNHHLPDGNKRSGVLVLYYFYVGNGYHLLEQGLDGMKRISALAQEIAMIEGNLTDSQFLELRNTLARFAEPNDQVDA